MADRSSYSPSPDFVKRAHIPGPDAYAQLRKRAADDPEGFWGELAEKELHWFEKWSRTLDWKAPFAKWFVGGKINASYNCLDRHLKANLGNKTALIWEGENGDQKTFNYAESY